MHTVKEIYKVEIAHTANILLDNVAGDTRYKPIHRLLFENMCEIPTTCLYGVGNL